MHLLQLDMTRVLGLIFAPYPAAMELPDLIVFRPLECSFFVGCQLKKVEKPVDEGSHWSWHLLEI